MLGTFLSDKTWKKGGDRDLGRRLGHDETHFVPVDGRV